MFRRGDRLMLVLSRKVNERIKIGEGVEITVVSISGDTVKIGIDASKEVKILRSEVYEEISRQNQAAAETSDLEQSLEAINALRAKMVKE
ncbi:carbon storage regulator CsrA [Syntrophobotulus glycolicus]|nr:carbon storage regulator CsrA [Syntrophobotulus glycolicus]